MRPLSDPADLVAVVAAQYGGHPWARICAEGAVSWAGGWQTAGAVVWRSGHPWAVAPRTHALGEPPALAAAVSALHPAGEDVVVPAGALLAGPGLGAPHNWSVRLRARPCPPQPGEDEVRWLEDDAAVRTLLAVANPHPAVVPGDALGGRWCGAYDHDGLVACAVETRPAAPRGHLSSLAVHPRARRAGWGGAVTAWFVRASLAAGAPEVLLAVDEGNAGAERLYDRLGFDRWPMTSYDVPGGYYG